jgi:ElaA protein
VNDNGSGALRRAWAADLTPGVLYALLRLRERVFVVEQGRAYPELDGRDLEGNARHFWVEGDDKGPLGCVRLVEEDFDVLRIGRMCVDERRRSRGMARRLMEAALADAGEGCCVLDAPRDATGFYSRFGFEVDGEEFSDHGIPTLSMRRVAARRGAQPADRR